MISRPNATSTEIVRPQREYVSPVLDPVMKSNIVKWSLYKGVSLGFAAITTAESAVSVQCFKNWLVGTARGLGFDILSGYILSFLLLFIQEGQLSVTGASMCTYYWLTA